MNWNGALEGLLWGAAIIAYAGVILGIVAGGVWLLEKGRYWTLGISVAVFILLLCGTLGLMVE